MATFQDYWGKKTLCALLCLFQSQTSISGKKVFFFKNIAVKKA
jgi:hypothetical protein